MLADGYTMKEIARAPKIPTRTVAFHKCCMMEQLGIMSSAELVQLPVKLRLVSG